MHNSRQVRQTFFTSKLLKQNWLQVTKKSAKKSNENSKKEDPVVTAKDNFVVYWERKCCELEIKNVYLITQEPFLNFFCTLFTTNNNK